MNNLQNLNRKYESVAWGMLAMLWGVTILFDFIPFGVGLIGTGLIFLGVNVVRLINQLPARSDNTVLGTLTLTWGGLEFARPFLRHLFPSADLDWVIFAILLIGLGLILLTQALLHVWKRGLGTFITARKEQ